MISRFNGTSTPKGSYLAKTGDNDCNVNSSHYSLRTALCESICYQAKSEQNARQDLIPMVRHGEASLMHPGTTTFVRLLISNSPTFPIGYPWNIIQHNEVPLFLDCMIDEGAGIREQVVPFSHLICHPPVYQTQRVLLHTNATRYGLTFAIIPRKSS